MPAVGEPRLFDVLVARGHDMSLPNERGLVLDGHDSPHARLTAAIRLLSSADPCEPWREGYESDLIAEWLRWLGIDLDSTASKSLGRQVQDLVRGCRSSQNGYLEHRDAAEIIAHAREDVPRLIAEIRRLKADQRVDSAETS